MKATTVTNRSRVSYKTISICNLQNGITDYYLTQHETCSPPKQSSPCINNAYANVQNAKDLQRILLDAIKRRRLK
jgi:hypothetical protein